MLYLASPYAHVLYSMHTHSSLTVHANQRRFQCQITRYLYVSMYEYIHVVMHEYMYLCTNVCMYIGIIMRISVLCTVLVN